MSSISSSSAYSVSASNNGISGLASGMDTDSMVEKMLSGTQNKINKQQALQQQLTWKQEMYQDVTAEINAFKSKYIDTAFDSILGNNLANPDFFNSMSSSVNGGSSQYLKIISSSAEASVGDMSVIVKQLASAAKLSPDTNHAKLSKNQIKGGVDASKIAENFQKKEVAFKVGDKDVSVDLSGVSASTDIVARLNDAFKKQGADASAKMVNGRISITSGSKDTDIKVDDDNSTDWGLQILGIAKGSVSSETSANAQALTGTLSPNITAGVSFDINLNGVHKTISIDPEATDTDKDGNAIISQEDVQRALGKAISRAFGGNVDQKDGSVSGGYINVTYDDNGNMTISAADQYDQITITGASAKALGITPGSTNRVTTTTTLSELSDEIRGGSFKFSINGVDFSFTGDDTLGTMINKINSSAAGVKVSYSSLSDSFTMEANSTGSRFAINLSQQEGNLLSALFGDNVIAAGSAVSSSRLTKGTIEGAKDVDHNAEMEKPSFSINVDGESYTFKADSDKVNISAAIEEINAKLKEKFGDDIQIDHTTNSLKITGNHYVTFDQSSVNLTDSNLVDAAKKVDLAFALGFNTSAKTNAADEKTTIDDLALSDAEKTALKNLLADPTKADATIQNVLDSDTIKEAGITFENGRFIASNENAKAVALLAVDGNDGLRALFDLAADKDLKSITGDGAMKGEAVQGTDAKVTVNGIDITRSSNTFTVDGITMQVTKAMEPDGAVNPDLYRDVQGNLVDKHGYRVTEDGFRFDKDGNLLDNQGFIVNSDGKRIDKYGNLLDQYGYVVNESGFRIDMDGNLLDNVGYVIDIAGNRMKDASGNLIASAKGPIASAAQAGNGGPVVGAGWPLTPMTASYNNAEPVTISTERNVDSIVETLKNFVNDYNTMLDKLNGYVYADATYRNYDPLTNEQKKEMSEKEIELWEEKAKEGLLRNDSDISYFLSQMRIALYTKPESSNFALYDIGIDTSSYSDRGKLTFDETALRKALADDPESVKNLFTDSASGLARQMATIIDNTSKVSTLSPGALVQKAGAKGTKIKSSDNDIYNQLKDIKDKIKDLQSKYESERERYWKMFTNMETNLSNLNTQSSWLYQQFSYGQ